MITSIADRILGLHGWAAVVVVFLLPALESSAFIGFLFPGEIGVLIGGVLASQHKVGQLICQRGSIAECERAQAPIFFGNGTHELNPPASVGISSGLNP